MKIEVLTKGRPYTIDFDSKAVEGLRKLADESGVTLEQAAKVIWTLADRKLKYWTSILIRANVAIIGLSAGLAIGYHFF